MLTLTQCQVALCVMMRGVRERQREREENIDFDYIWLQCDLATMSFDYKWLGEYLFMLTIF